MKIKPTVTKMTEKIPTLDELKKSKSKRIMKQVVEAIISLIHNGLCMGADFVDFPFVIYNEEENQIVTNIIQEFADKDYKIEKIANIPQEQMTSKGKISSHITVHRFDLKEATENKLKFHDKMRFKISKKSALVGKSNDN